MANAVFAAAGHVAGGIFLNQGQDCAAGSRLYVQSSIYDAFLKELKVAADEWTAGFGDNFKEGALGGPLVSKAQRDKVVNYVEGAKQAGASILHGGTKWEGKGWYYLPTSNPPCLLLACEPPVCLHLVPSYRQCSPQYESSPRRGSLIISIFTGFSFHIDST